MSLPAANELAAIAADLRAHMALCEEVLATVTREGQALRGEETSNAFEFFHERQSVLPRLDESLGRLKRHRQTWQRVPGPDRARHPEITALLRSAQELIMRIIVLDRENEQALLRRGLVPPRHLPPAQRQRPHYVVDLYRRHAPS